MNRLQLSRCCCFCLSQTGPVQYGLVTLNAPGLTYRPVCTYYPITSNSTKLLKWIADLRWASSWRLASVTDIAAQAGWWSGGTLNAALWGAGCSRGAGPVNEKHKRIVVSSEWPHCYDCDCHPVINCVFRVRNWRLWNQVMPPHPTTHTTVWVLMWRWRSTVF